MMQTTMLKFTPSSSIIKKPQIHFTNLPNIHMITNNKPFRIANFPKVHITNKPLHISSCCKKDNADANSVSKDVPKNLQSAFEPILSIVKWVFSSEVKLDTPYRFVVKNDLILFEHDGEEIVGVVEHVVYHPDELIETTLLCEHGLLENFKISGYNIINQTLLNEEENEKTWRISTRVVCKDGDWKKMVAEIQDILNAHDDVQHNFVVLDTFRPEKKIAVNGFVTVSKLKTPHFEHYMEVRRKMLSEIDEIRIKHGGSKEESALGNRVKLRQSR